jgi:hypothetical protein
MTVAKGLDGGSPTPLPLVQLPQQGAQVPVAGRLSVEGIFTTHPARALVLGHHG